MDHWPEMDYTFFLLANPFLELTLGLFSKFTFSRLTIYLLSVSALNITEHN